jgi:hypothetical protein
MNASLVLQASDATDAGKIAKSDIIVLNINSGDKPLEKKWILADSDSMLSM